MIADFLPTADRQALEASAALALAQELHQQRLEVAICPAPRGQHPDHGIRQVISTNPTWYQDLCQRRRSQAHPRRTKHDTAIKRQHVLTGLHQIAAGQPGRYRDLLVPLVQTVAFGDQP